MIYSLTDTDFTPEAADEDNVAPEPADDESDAGGEIEVEDEDIEEAEEVVDNEEADDMFDPIAEARRAFKRFDADGNGTLNTKELFKALLLTGTFMKRKKVRKLIKKYDKDGSGSLSFEEFIKLPGVIPVDRGGAPPGDDDDDD